MKTVLQKCSGSSDFFGLNHYSTRLVSMMDEEGCARGKYGEMTLVKEEVHPDWKG